MVSHWQDRVQPPEKELTSSQTHEMAYLRMCVEKARRIYEADQGDLPTFTNIRPLVLSTITTLLRYPANTSLTKLNFDDIQFDLQEEVPELLEQDNQKALRVVGEAFNEAKKASDNKCKVFSSDILSGKIRLESDNGDFHLVSDNITFLGGEIGRNMQRKLEAYDVDKAEALSEVVGKSVCAVLREGTEFSHHDAQQYISSGDMQQHIQDALNLSYSARQRPEFEAQVKTIKQPATECLMETIQEYGAEVGRDKGSRGSSRQTELSL